MQSFFPADLFKERRFFYVRDTRDTRDTLPKVNRTHGAPRVGKRGGARATAEEREPQKRGKWVRARRNGKRRWLRASSTVTGRVTVRSLARNMGSSVSAFVYPASVVWVGDCRRWGEGGKQGCHARKERAPQGTANTYLARAKFAGHRTSGKSFL